MKKIIACFTILALFACFTHSFAATPKSDDPDAKIKREMIKRSIENYKGPCPCPYSKDKDGNYCGKYSAYSKPWTPDPPMCYFRNINKPMIDAYLQEKEAAKAAKKAQKKKPAAAPAKPKEGG